MKFGLHAACICNTGKIRSNNEDNFYFCGQVLEEVNAGLKEPIVRHEDLKQHVVFAVFDGMGGENYGEAAAYAAAHAMQGLVGKKISFMPGARYYLENITQEINMNVVDAAKAHGTTRMGSTMAAVCIYRDKLYVCNLGDSRVFFLHDNILNQISKDHVAATSRNRRKPALTQHLGIDPQIMRIEPHIAKFDIHEGDVCILCSDGITDMLSEQEIAEIINNDQDPRICAVRLETKAMEHGGRDNLTAIVCKFTKAVKEKNE